MIQRVEDMPVYELFYNLALDIERATRNYGVDFRWLRQQTIRASESVCANMAEGFYSQYSTEYVQSLYRCRREARETAVHLAYARDVGILDKSKANELIERYDDCLRQLAGLTAGVERKIELRGKTKPISHVEEEMQESAAIDHQALSVDHEPLTIDH